MDHERESMAGAADGQAGLCKSRVIYTKYVHGIFAQFDRLFHRVETTASHLTARRNLVRLSHFSIPCC